MKLEGFDVPHGRKFLLVFYINHFCYCSESCSLEVWDKVFVPEQMSYALYFGKPHRQSVIIVVASAPHSATQRSRRGTNE